MEINPTDHAERVALFRAQLLGPVLHGEHSRGDLLAELRLLAKRRFRAPGSDTTRSYSVSTLLRWRRAYLAKGLAGLRPVSRRTGDAQGLSDEQRELVLEIRRQHPSVPANVILDTLEGDGRVAPGQVSAQTLRRLYRREQLARQPKAKGKGARVDGERRRWEASYPGALWHADVCHGKTLKADGKRIPVRIHAILDDASRFIVALRVYSHEREIAMLELMLEAVRNYGAPKVLYLDNGATYRGAALSTVCGRLGTTLLHPNPYDPQARGKMERFWHTLRMGCLDHIGEHRSIHDIDVRLKSFVSERYHKAAHAGLIGAAPATRWADRTLVEHSGDELEAALTVRATRRVRKDCTLSVGNQQWEVTESFLATRKVCVARTLANTQKSPWIEHEGRIYELRLVDPVANGKQKRKKPTPGVDAVDFDPATVLLHRATRQLSKYVSMTAKKGGNR